jgi:hypothetical protein
LKIITSTALAAVAAAIAIASLTAGPATAATPKASLPGAGRSAAEPDDDLAGVVCATVKDCLAVGGNSTSPVVAPLAVRWNGTAWKPVSVKLPAGAVAGWLDAVSCLRTAGAHCLATGAFIPKNFAASGNSTGLADAWSGKAWKPTPVSGIAGVELDSVSCLSANDCLAVGTDESPVTGASNGLAYRWNGVQWTEDNPPMPPGGTNQLTSVSCTAGPFCIAVGSTWDKQLIDRWNGSTWTTMKPAAPKGSVSAALVGVSCASRRSCMAVGNNSGGPAGAFAELWNGKKWTVTAPMTFQPGVTVPAATSVSCAPSGYCMAMGNVHQDPIIADMIDGLAAASAWNGKKWTAATVPGTGPDQETNLYGVSCLKATFCVAVGEYDSLTGTPWTRALSGFWDGRRWRLKAAT